MKKCNFDFSAFLGNEDAKNRVAAFFESERFPHAILITGEAGSGAGAFARLLAAEWLGDTRGLVARGAHPDCLVISGEGASGRIPVERIRELAYELHMAGHRSDGRRAAILRNAKNLGRSASNALLKILEEPPAGVLFLLTAQNNDDVLETIRSRCAVITLQTLTVDQCAEQAARCFPEGDKGRIKSLSTLYNGRLGLVIRALDEPGRLGLVDAARELSEAMIARDKLKALIALNAAADRDMLRLLLEDTLRFMRTTLAAQPTDSPQMRRMHLAISSALRALDRYTTPKLVSAAVVAAM